MLRITFLTGAAVFALGTTSPSIADTAYYCVPNEPRVTASDRLVSVEITLRPNGEFASVVYRAANGAAYDRGKQYEATNNQADGQQFWIGRLRGNRNVGMLGSFHTYGGRLFYVETVHDNLQGGKVVSQITSACDNGRPLVAEAPPRASTPPSAPYPKAELQAFINCIDAAAVALATVSNEPAQTIVDAALGECPKERAALEGAAERQGIAQSVDFVDGLAKEARPTLLALVLNARVAASQSAGTPAKPEPAKGEPL